MKFKGKILTVLGATLAAVAYVSCSNADANVADPGLRDVFADRFMIGAAINEGHVAGLDSLATGIITKHFNTIVAENVMKSEKINPQKGVYDWAPADAFVKFGNDHNMFVVGHCLVWHSQLAPWFPLGDNGAYVSADTLRARMRTYIYDVVGRYKGKVHAWDVVNEAILDDGSYRESPFYTILGEEFIPLAFTYAHEADPDAELYINDYSMDKPGKRAKYVELVNSLKAAGIRIDGIGMQSHVGMDYPNFAEYEKSVEAFGNTGCKVMATEWDMSAIPTITESANIADTEAYRAEMNPYPNGLPEEVDKEWNLRMDSLLTILVRHSDVVSRVNAWGVIDSDSWKNDWPMVGRTDYPLLFDRRYQMKPFLKKYVEEYTSNTKKSN